jgi:hypothetical protein
MKGRKILQSVVIKDKDLIYLSLKPLKWHYSRISILFTGNNNLLNLKKHFYYYCTVSLLTIGGELLCQKSCIDPEKKK